MSIRTNSLPTNQKIHTRVELSRGWVSLRLKELWAYRELIYFFAWRDIKVRYKQTIMGASWAIMQPLFSMVIFSLVFGSLAKLPSDGVPYPIFSYAALVPWSYFSTVILGSSNSILVNAGMIKKIYFPRLTVPIASILSGGLDFVFAFLVLIGMMLFYGFVPGWRLLAIFPLLLLALMTALGVGLWLGSLNVQFRDVRYTVAYIIQAWLFISPIAYPSNLLPAPWNVLYGINPMAGVVEGFRWALLGTEATPGLMFIPSFFVSLTIFISGLYYFRRTEKLFADIV